MHKILPSLSTIPSTMKNLPLFMVQATKDMAVSKVTTFATNHAGKAGKTLAIGALAYECHSHGKNGRIINLTERVNGAKLHYQAGQKALQEIPIKAQELYESKEVQAVKVQYQTGKKSLQEGYQKAKEFYESEEVQTAKKTTIEAVETTAKVTGLVFMAITVGFIAYHSPIGAICIAITS
jgi:hypothetical protein